MHLWKSFLINLLEYLIRPIVWVHLKADLIRRIFYLSTFRLSCKNPVSESTQFDGPLRVVGTGNIKIGKHCRLGRGVTLETMGKGEIIIGDNVRINTGTFVTSRDKVIIGDDTMIGEYVSIRDANHGLILGKLVREQRHNCAKISIGNDVWIGRGCCILKEVNIGNGSVIAANSVVTKNVPENMIYAGAPVRKIGNRSYL